MMREKRAEDLKVGDVLALPMGKTATITEVEVGRKFVKFVTKEFGKARAEIGHPMLLEGEVVTRYAPIGNPDSPTPAPHSGAAAICERHNVAFYRIWYRKGWRRSEAVGDIPASADRLPIDAGNAWMDGYLDCAAGREPWHLWGCRAHHNQEGGCGLA